MKLIRIDQDVWKTLMQNAVPLVDTPNDVLRRLLGIDERKSSRTRRKRLLPGSGRTDQGIFAIPILEVVKELGGKGDVKKILHHLESKMKSRLTPIDHEKLKSGQVRWKNTTQWARNELVSDGLLAKDSPRGVWEITEKGREHLKKTTNREEIAELSVTH